MKDFTSGVAAGTADAEYLRWLQDHPEGVVLNLAEGRDGRYTVHRTDCQTLTYDFAAKGQSERTGKWCFDSKGKFQAWRDTKAGDADLNVCGRCKPSV